MIIFRPSQLSFNPQVLEQNRRFYFVASATLGVDLVTGEERLDMLFLKDMFEAMQDTTLPDTGMPKPHGEILVTGQFFAPGKEPANAGNVMMKCGNVEKQLYIFGPRTWQQGIPSSPEAVLSIPLSYTHAFGGRNFEPNPDGMGFNDGRLPCIENPKHLVGAPDDKPEPAGFAPLPPMHPRRKAYQGTYGLDYKEKYYPGYPQDMDWRYFLNAPSDQWVEKFHSITESFALKNMHPDMPLIEGSLPGLRARCFLNMKENDQTRFNELPLNLDTIWFFPEKTLGIMIFRGVLEVRDDEAEEITHVLMAYESHTQPPKSFEHYKASFEIRKDSDDELLKIFNTPDLIPNGHKTAMQLLVDMAVLDVETAPGELEKNIEAKKEAMLEEMEKKLEDTLQHAEKSLEELPDGKEKPDIKKILDKKSEAKPDPDTEELIQKLEAVLPGITSENAKKLDAKNLSFDILDDIEAITRELIEKKKKEASALADPQIKKNAEQIKEQITSLEQQIEATKTLGSPEAEKNVKTLEDTRNKLSKTLKTLEDIDLEKPTAVVAVQPLPRLNADAFMAQLTQMEPAILNTAQQVEIMKAAGIEDESTRSLEAQVKEIIDKNKEFAEKELKKAKKSMYDGYWTGAHFMDPGSSPHNESVEEIRDRFLSLLSDGAAVSGGDFACIDLSGQNLDGVDLSYCYLEQVNLKGASLKGANLTKAILARACLDDANLAGTNLTQTNIGAVSALNTDFSNAILKSAKLSRGNFSGANFSSADLEEIEALETVFGNTEFSNANIPGTQFVELSISDTRFTGANLGGSVFVGCNLSGVDFSNALVSKSAFVNVSFANTVFAGADLFNTCFVSTEPENHRMENMDFQNAHMKMANFQDMWLKGSNFCRADIENALFNGADLTEADLSFAHAPKAMFRKARLNKANLEKIDLNMGFLSKANLVDASFKGGNLYAVDFLRATITRTEFSFCNLDATIIENWRPE